MRQVSQKKSHISCFHNSYTFLNKGKTPIESTISSSDSKKNLSYVTQVVANKMVETGITQ